MENQRSNADILFAPSQSNPLRDGDNSIASNLNLRMEPDSRHGTADVSNLTRQANAENLVPKLTLSGQIENTDKIDKPGNYSETIMVDGTPRHFLLHVPANYNPSEPMPLLLVLHGYTGNSAFIEKVSGMDAEADKKGFIVAYPDATQWFGDKQLSAWDTGNGLTPPEQHANDIGFLRKLIDNCQSRLSVDQNRVYLDGFSNGGMETYKAAGELSDKLAAVVDISGAMGGAERKPNSPVSVLTIVGSNDYIVPPSGRTKEQVASSGIPDLSPLLHKILESKEVKDGKDDNNSKNSKNPKGSHESHETALDPQDGSDQYQKLALKYGIVPDFKPVTYATDFWKSADGISGPGIITHNGAITTETYTNPQNGITVEQETVEGANHCILEGAPSGFNLPDETWKFLEAHSKASQ